MVEGGKIAVTGASGLVGQALVPALRDNGYEVLRLVRRVPRAQDEVEWDPAAGTIDLEALKGVAGAVHLAGENIGSGRWTEAKKTKIRDSRVQGTRLLAGALAKLSSKPRVLVSASGINYYGTSASEPVDEHSESGSGFLASVCRQWEAATSAAHDAGIRVVIARFGMVLSSEGGALEKMMIPFKLGVGGRLGHGMQYMSWITREDLVSAILFALKRDDLGGPVNFVSPSPVTNADFTATLGRVLKRPAVFPVPEFALRLALGSEMANELLLGSLRVIPAELHGHGFEWRHPTLEPALRSIL
jgi:uncharacterized protein (TIGR01777 family)